MLSTSPCRAIYRLEFPIVRSSTHRVYLPATTIHVAFYSNKVSSANNSYTPKPINTPVRNKASAATSYTPKPSATITPPTVIEHALPTDPALRLNPTSSTRPPPLTFPSLPPSSSTFKYYYSIGRAYLTFYKTGLKNLYANYKLTNSLSERLPSSQSPEEGLHDGVLTRAEWLTIKRNRADLLRLPLFGLVFCICGEFTPLVVLVMSGVVPRSLWIPKQVEKARRQIEERRKEVFRNPDPALGLEAELKNGKVDEMAKPVILHIGRSLGLYSTLWDRMGIPPTPIVRRRVKKHMAFVDLDDAVIERDGGVEPLDGEEATMAAEVRGIDVMGRNEEELKLALKDWLQARKILARKDKAVTWLYLTRPAAWPLRD